MRFPRVQWRRIGSGRVLPWALAAIFFVTSLVNWWLLRSERREDARAETVRSTASAFLTDLTTFSATTIDEDVQRIESYAVGQFATQVHQTFSPKAVAQIKSSKVV